MAKTVQNMVPIEALSCSNVTWSISSKLAWQVPNQLIKSAASRLSINQSFNVMFHASTGQTLTRTSQRHDSRSGAIDGSKFNLFKSISDTFLPGLSTLPSANITRHLIFNATFNPVSPYHPFALHVHTSVICSLSQSMIYCLFQVDYIALYLKVCPVKSQHTFSASLCVQHFPICWDPPFSSERSHCRKPWHFWHSSSLSAYEMLHVVSILGQFIKLFPTTTDTSCRGMFSTTTS